MADKTEIQIEEWRQGFFRSGGSVTRNPQNLAVVKHDEHNRSVDKTKSHVQSNSQNNNRMSLFTFRKTINITVGDNSQAHVQLGSFWRIAGRIENNY